MAPFKAIYLTSTGDITIKTILSPYQPHGSQTLIRVDYSGINPGDFRHFYMGMHSFVMGYDFVGTVISTGPESSFQPGDSVLGMTKPGHNRPSHLGAHQAYLLAESSYLLWRRPESLSPLAAVRLPSAAQTAADALFNVLGFAFPPLADSDTVSGIDPCNNAILIWGGAGSVGHAAVQLASAAGFSAILVTASEMNHALLKDAGATHCFDYRVGDAVVAEQIREAVRELGIPLKAIFDAVGKGLGVFELPGVTPGNYADSSCAIAKRCLSDEVLAAGSGPDGYRLCCVLPVLQDSEWLFALYSRKHDAEQEREYPGWWQRQERIVTWLVENHETVWKPLLPRPRVVNDSASALEAIRGSFEGKLGREKVVIRHPMV